MKFCPDPGLSTFIKLNDSMVHSILLYAAELWGFKDAPDSNAIHS